MRSIRSFRAVAGMTLGAILALALPALADTVLLGRVSPPDSGGCTSCASFQLKTEAGQPSYKVPKGRWRVTAWSAQGGGSADGEARLLVLRRTATPGRWKVVGRSRKETVPADGSPFFATGIKSKGGDRLGITTVDGLATGSVTGNAGDVARGIGCNPSEPGMAVGTGTSCPLNELPQTAINIEAKLRPR